MHNVHYVGESLDLELRSMNSCIKLRRDQSTKTFGVIDGWKRALLQAGYATYDDTFAYGHRALKEYPYLVSILCDRFPILFIDEAQDNSEDQSAILYRIFRDGHITSICQRFGDPNQAIYRSMGDKGATTYAFPDNHVKKYDMPKSHRFGQAIADLADPLGLTSYPLTGQGPRKPLASGAPHGPHTIFLFDENNTYKVMDAYIRLLTDTFSQEELTQGTFTAVGQIHNPPDEEREHKFPHHIGHYWRNYDPQHAKSDLQPQSFVKYAFHRVD